MTRWLSFALACAFLCAAAVAQSGSRHQSRTERTIAAGTRFETTALTIDSGEEGPTVLLTGGIHGNEPAGSSAAEQIAGWTIARGKLVVVARANVTALAANKRRTPGLPKARSDLNRQFPRQKGEVPTGVLATALWQLTNEVQPDYLVDLHEGYDFTRINPKSVGSSVIATQPMRSIAQKMIAAIDATIEPANKKFQLKGPPIAGSLARGAHEALAIPSMIVETTTKSQSRAYRTRQHRILVYTLLVELDLIDAGTDPFGPHVLLGSSAPNDRLKIALYASTGVGGRGPANLREILSPDAGFALRRVCAHDVRDGVLAQFDVVIFPGGSGSKQGRNLRAEGRHEVAAFVRDGGGYVGICAGAYLAANNYDWSLGILDANVIDRAHWKRGTGDVDLEATGTGTQLVALPAKSKIRYANGPLYAPADDPEIPDFEVLAHFRSEIRENNAPVGVMLDTPALVLGKFGAGRVICSSPHPEATPGFEEAVRAIVRSAAGAHTQQRGATTGDR